MNSFFHRLRADWKDKAGRESGRKWRREGGAHGEVVERQGRDGGRVSRQLGDVAQLLQVPQDAGEVAGAAHDHAVHLGHSQARHGVRVTVQRLVGGESQGFRVRVRITIRIPLLIPKGKKLFFVATTAPMKIVQVKTSIRNIKLLNFFIHFCKNVSSRVVNVCWNFSTNKGNKTDLPELHAGDFVLGGHHVPHAHHRAGSRCDDGGRVGRGGAQRLPPVTQALTHSRGLRTHSRMFITIP